MAYNGQQNGDIRATLALSQEEASNGTNRTLNLPGGRQVVIPIPAGTYNGQEIRLPGQGEFTGSGTRGSLILTIAIAPAEYFGSQNFPQPGTDFPTIFSETPPPPPRVSSPHYPPVNSAGNYTNYAQYPSQTPGRGIDQQGMAAAPYNPPPQYVPQYPSSPPKRRGMPRGLIALLILLALLIILGGGGLIFFTTVVQPNQLHAQATATAVSKATGTAQANATATAQITATAQAQAHATATAQAQSTAQAQATASALQAIYTQATGGTPVLDDPMTHQDGNSWEVDTKTGGGGCAFTGGNYHATMPQVGFFASCFASNTNFSNFALQVQMNILKGDRGGLIFRADSTGTKFYLLRIDQAGSYDLYVYINNNGNDAKNILTGSSAAIHSGTNQQNNVTVIARSGSIYIYINQQYVANIADSTYSSGSIAVFAEDHTNATDVVFTRVQVWKL